MFKPKIFDKYGDEILHIDIIPNIKNYTLQKVKKIIGRDLCRETKWFWQLVNQQSVSCSICGQKAYYIGLILNNNKDKVVKLYDKYGTYFNVDHIIPQSLGGSNNIANLAISCQVCNNKKGNHLPDGTKAIIKDGKFVPL